MKQQDNEANDSSFSTAFVIYCSKYWRARMDHPSMSDIKQAQKDAFTMKDILIDGLGLRHKNVILIADPDNMTMLALNNTLKARFRANAKDPS